MNGFQLNRGHLKAVQNRHRAGGLNPESARRADEGLNAARRADSDFWELLCDPYWVKIYPYSVEILMRTCHHRIGHTTMDPKSEWHQGYMTLRYSNWTSCSPQNLFHEHIFRLSEWAKCSISHFLHAEEKASQIEPHNEVTPRGVWPREIQVGQFVVHKTYFMNMYFHFLSKKVAAFPACRGKGTPYWTPKVGDTNLKYLTGQIRALSALHCTGAVKNLELSYLS